MMGTLLQIGWLNLKRDKVALGLTFVLPIVFFSIFAFIFGGIGGDSLPKVQLVVVDEDQSETSKRLVHAIEQEDGFRGPSKNDAHALLVQSSERAIGLVRERDCDAALVIPKGFGESFGMFNSDAPPIALYADDVVNPVAAQVVIGLMQKIAMMSVPDLAIERGIGMFEQYAGALTDQQRAAMERFLPELRSLTDRRMTNQTQPSQAAGTAASAAPQTDGSPSGDFMSPIRIERKSVQSLGEQQRKAGVSYQAAGIGVMFLLFSMAGAMGALLHESATGTLERLLSSRMTMGRFLLSNWVFAVMMGFAQLTVMFIWGWAVFGVELWTLTHVTGFIAMSLVSAAAAAGFGLMLGTACRSQGQLQGISTVVILCMSAIGGSMVPRFILKQNTFMDIAGLFTFNGWALDGFQKVFWDDKPVWALWPQLAVLAGMAAVFMFVARQFARRWEAM